MQKKKEATIHVRLGTICKPNIFHVYQVEIEKTLAEKKEKNFSTEWGPYERGSSGGKQDHQRVIVDPILLIV